MKPSDWVEELRAEGVSVRTLNVLWNAGIRSIEQLATFRSGQLLRLRYCGPASVAELRAALRRRGLTFACEGDGAHELSSEVWP